MSAIPRFADSTRTSPEVREVPGSDITHTPGQRTLRGNIRFFAIPSTDAASARRNSTPLGPVMMRALDPACLLRGPSHSANQLTQLASNSSFWEGVLNPNHRSITETPTGSHTAGLLFPLPPPHVGIPGTVGEQAIQIGKVGVVIDEEAQAFAIFFAWPPASPHLSSRIITVEVRTAKRCPTAMRTAFNVAAVAMAFADGRTAIRAGFELYTHETELFNDTEPIVSADSRRPNHAARSTSKSISLRNVTKSIGLVNSPSAPLSRALRFVSAVG